MILVVSTGNGSPDKARCIASVAAQRGVEFQHIYVDAAGQSPSLGALQNQHDTIAREAAADDIVALVDGDDWLPHPGCLARVQAEHDAGAWLTWGSFAFADGRHGIAAEYGADDPRSTPWRMSHLKTFRAGLFHRIKRADLERDGRWLTHARDLAVMFPMYEMCPAERRRFIPDTIYNYNLAASFEWSASVEDLQAEQVDVAYVRSLPRYETVGSL